MKSRLLAMWAIGASVAAVGFTLIALWFFFESKPQTAKVSQPGAVVSESSTQLPNEGTDFSNSNALTISLGEGESINAGIRHLDREPDGRTTFEVLDGVPCRYLNFKPRNKSIGYFYFAIDPTFNWRGLRKVRVEVEYLDPSPGLLGMHYDAVGVPPNAYKQVHPRIQLSGAGVWQVGSFELKDPAFLHSQNGGADFRFWVEPPELYVRRVIVIDESGNSIPYQSRQQGVEKQR